MWLLVLIGAIAVVAAPWLMRRRRPPADSLHGTLLITGVSPPPDATGEQFVTVAGVINGPSVNEHVVYQRWAVDTGSWPRVGDLVPVMYSAKNPDHWRAAPPEPTG